MENLCDDDYLIEITLRLAVRKKDAAKVIELGKRGAAPVDSEDEEENIRDALLNLLDVGLVEHDNLIDFASLTSQRVPTVDLFNDISTLGNLPESDARAQAVQTA